VIGTPGYVGSSTASDGSENAGGRVDVFEYDPDSPSKGYVQLGSVIYGETLGDDFGSSVSINNDGTIIAASAPKADGDESGTEPERGEIRVFELDTSGATPVWTKLGNTILGEESGAHGGGGLVYHGNSSYSAADPTATALDYEYIGDAIKLSGNGHRIVIGSPLSDFNGQSTDSGAVEIYTYDSTQNPAWSKLGDTLRGTAAHENFGSAVSMNDAGDRIVVGSPFLVTAAANIRDGRATVFEYVVNAASSAKEWRQVGSVIQDLTSGAGGTVPIWFAASVSMSADGDRIAIGSPGSYVNNLLYRGTVQVRELDKSTYTGLFSGYGSATGITGNFNLISEPISDISTTTSNSNYYYEWFGTDVVISSDGSKLIASNSAGWNSTSGSTNSGNQSTFYTYASVFQL
jgi:hypothetical protein